jgi:transketolase
MPHANIQALQQKCTEVRLSVLDQVAVAGSGHYGPAFSATEIFVALYYGFLRVDGQRPHWPERDRFVLSKGHACSGVYPILADLGFFDAEHLKTFTRLNSILGDHPDCRKVPGFDFSSGSLGHGLSVACGMAEGVRHQGFNSRVACVIGDGEQNEGQIWEAAGYAGFRKLSNLICICDRNEVCVDGRTEDIMSVEPMADRWRAFGWHVEELDGHDLGALVDAFDAFEQRRREGGKPTFIVAKTVSGKGVDFIEREAVWHLGYLHGADDVEARRQINGMYAQKQKEDA